MTHDTSWEQMFDDEFTQEYVGKGRQINCSHLGTDATEGIKDFIRKELETAREEGRNEAVNYIKKEAGITPDLSPVNDYVIPFKILEAARTLPTQEKDV